VTATQPAPSDAQPGQGPILEVRDLHVHFGARRGKGPTARAVDGVDLQVQPGEIVALAGESGCGKTSLARAILGLVEPTSGQVLYRGKPIGRGTSALKPYRREVQLGEDVAVEDHHRIAHRLGGVADRAAGAERRRLDHVTDRQARLAAVAEDFLDPPRLVVEAEDHLVDLGHLLEEIELVIKKWPVEDRHDRLGCVDRQRAQA